MREAIVNLAGRTERLWLVRAIVYSRWLSLVAEFGVLPLAVGWLVPPVWWLPVLWVIAGVAWWRLRGEGGGGESRTPIDWRRTALELRRIGGWFTAAAAVLLAIVAIRRPHELFDWPRSRPRLWLALMVLYPVLSVFAQEVLYRKFLFTRFRVLFRREWMLAAASAVAFAWLHLIFRNGWAVAMTLVGGCFFADTYRRTKSLRLVCLEHALYGNLVFTVGMGKFIFYGSVHG